MAQRGALAVDDATREARATDSDLSTIKSGVVGGKTTRSKDVKVIADPRREVMTETNRSNYKVSFLYFNSEDYNSWEMRYDNFFEMERIGDGERLRLVVGHLDRFVLLWYRGFVKEREIGDDLT